MGILQNLRGKVRLRTRWRNALAAAREYRTLSKRGLRGDGKGRTLNLVVFFVTNQCNSKCIHCGFWEQHPYQYLPLDVFEQIRDSPATDKDTIFCFQGGEFLLHPQAEEIIAMYEGRRVELFTNGMTPAFAKRLVRQYHVPDLKLSLDGQAEAYRKIRGVNAFQKVIDLAAEMARETRVTISYTITPWNTLEDFEFVRNFCREHGINFGVSILHDADIMDRKFDLQPIEYIDKLNLQEYGPVNEAFYRGYNPWLQGRKFVPCTSIFQQILVYPNGDIPLCHQTEKVVLGNVTQRKLEDIWWDPKTLELQRSYIKCNSCWNACHRNWDMKFYHPLSQAVPESWIEWWMKRGKYPVGHQLFKELQLNKPAEEKLAIRALPQATTHPASAECHAQHDTVNQH